MQYTGAAGDKPNPNTTFVVIDYGNGEKSDPIPLVLDTSGNMTVNYTYPQADGGVEATLILYNDADSFSQTVDVRSTLCELTIYNLLKKGKDKTNVRWIFQAASVESIPDGHLDNFNILNDILTKPQIPLDAEPEAPLVKDGRFVYQLGEPISINLTSVLVNDAGTPQG